MQIEGRNVLRIKLPFKRGGGGGGAGGTPTAGAGAGSTPAGGGGRSNLAPAGQQQQQQQQQGDPLAALAAAAEDGMDTGRRGAGPPADAPAVALLSKSLMRVGLARSLQLLSASVTRFACR